MFYFLCVSTGRLLLHPGWDNNYEVSGLQLKYETIKDKTEVDSLTSYVNFVAESDTCKFHPFSVLGLVLHVCDGQPRNVQPAASEGVQTRDGGDEAFVLAAASDDQEHLRQKMLHARLGALRDHLGTIWHQVG